MVTEAAQERAEARYERFVSAFGPAGTLSDRQLAALIDYCSDAIDQCVETTTSELLRGRVLDWESDTDDLDEHPPHADRCPGGVAMTMETDHVRITADVVLLTHADDVLHVLLIERGWSPFAGKPALPGGHVDPGETFVDAARRELFEETGLTAPAELDQVDVYGDPGRDPRGRYITVAFTGYLPGMPQPTAGDDAVAARWCPVEEILDLPGLLAFDHHRIVTHAVERLHAFV